ncbi:MFS transporter [Deinococcus sp. MIMF12]|uniref:MFS transporter n=1 Tax=Deinococcus rhizophilus TaxID=3049544 RepID=A0ABT7JGX1_9DEIO|nr:MFS transporter [Deinococcus rhizophilus]MDL2344289.1 MFS transporter [Deinococcus rhizophilus]
MAEPPAPAPAVPTAAAPALPLGRLFPLYAAQALATGATTVSTILAALVVGNLGFTSLIGLPATLISASAALSAGLFGALMLSRGRRVGLASAFVLGAVGAGLGFAGARAGLLPVFLLGASLMGAAQGGYQQARYAAAESVPESRRGTALGLLMLMSVAGSLLMTGFSGGVERLGERLGASPEVAGWLVGGGLLGVAALLMLVWRPVAGPAQRVAGARPGFAATFRQPGVRSTALALATAQGLMVTLMSLTPHRAHEMGVDHAGVAALISGHIVGMFGFGWLTGPLIDRLGVRVGYVGGSALLGAAALTATLPGTAWLGVSMFVLGLGWNLAFVSGSKALSRHPAAQGVTDGLGYVAAGAGTLLGGLIIARAGFPVLAYACAVLALLPLLSAWRAGR